ncbi:hypothetical protein [Bifidobacterium tibiigranuli]|jgi:hypothetical protein|uniref:hypothetical protein n=1 Tax=Bifidobacterium tibiigranuli TaxID=2172043 RepID=UPI0026F36466|nr:hypothetical protein [Bifidobacterium tibiigranuli]MCI2185067.1 hypothetical protein [Bifidobacterium tibiigranuli]MCI2203368.1 hypothetical protein [Bifidobacterium tibiigranuli]
MDQSVITLLASAISAIITGAIAILCSVIPKWVEIKNSTRETSRKEIKILIEKLNDTCSTLWEDSINLYQSYLEKLEYKKTTSGTQDYGNQMALDNYDQDIAFAEKEHSGCVKEAERVMFRISVQFPELELYAKNLVSSANPEPKQNPLDESVFINELTKMFISGNEIIEVVPSIKNKHESAENESRSKAAEILRKLK